MNLRLSSNEDRDLYYNVTSSPIDEYNFLQNIFSRNSGHVDLVSRICDDQTVVRKRIHLPEGFLPPRSLNDLLKLSHPNLVKYYQYICGEEEGLFIMEYCENKNLKYLVENEKNLLKGRFMPECQIISWFYEMCCGVDYLHQRNMIHRHLKPENILVNNEGRLLVGDYLLSTLFSNHDPRVLLPSAYQFMPPELWDNKSAYNNKVDIWSLGCLLYYMCAYSPPFKGISLGNLSDAVSNQQTPPISNVFSKELRDLLSRILSKKPNDRPSIKEVLHSGLFKDVSQEREDAQKFLHYQAEEDRVIPKLRQKSSENSTQHLISISVESSFNETVSEPCPDLASLTESPREEMPTARQRNFSLQRGVIETPGTSQTKVQCQSDSISNQSLFNFRWHGMELRTTDSQGRYPIIDFHDSRTAATAAWICAVDHQTECSQLSLPPMRLSFCNTVIVAWFWRRGDDLRMGAKLHRNSSLNDDTKCVCVRMRVDIVVRLKKGVENKKKFFQEQVAHIHPNLGWWSQVMTFKSFKFQQLDSAVLPQVSIAITQFKDNESLWFSGLAPTIMKIDWKNLGGCENWCENWKKIVANTPNWRLHLSPYPVRIGKDIISYRDSTITMEGCALPCFYRNEAARFVVSEIVVIGLLRRNSHDCLCLHLALHYNTPGDVTLTAGMTFSLSLTKRKDAVAKKETILLKYSFEHIIQDMTPSIGPSIDLLPPVITIPDVPWDKLDPLAPPVSSMSITCKSVGGCIIFS